MKKQPQITTQTQDKLFEAFWSFYCKKKIEHITIKEITDKAGYHRSTFYEYFIDIYDVLDQLENALLEHIQKNAINRFDGELSIDLAQNIANIYDEKGEYLSVLLGENGDPNFLKKIKDVVRPVLTDTLGFFGNDIRTVYIFEFATSGIFAVATQWYRNGKDIPSQELVGLVRSMLMGGVFPIIEKYSDVS